MEHVIDFSVAMVAWVVAVVKSRHAWYGRHDPVVARSWIFVFLFALCMTFQVDVIYLSFDRMVGAPNLAWLIAYGFFIGAIYFAASACLAALKAPVPWWLPPLTLATLLTILLIFPTAIATIPEQADHTTPQSGLELIFMMTLYVYAVVTGTIPLRTFAHFYGLETTVAARLRTGTFLLGVTLAVSFFAMAIVTGVLKFWRPTLPFLPQATLLVRMLMGSAGLMWALGFLPQRVFVTLARPLGFGQKLAALRELRHVQAQLDQLCPSVGRDPLTYWTFWRHLDFHLYRSVIGILDGKRMLAAYLEGMGNEKGIAFTPDQNEGAAIGRTAETRWDAATRRRAMALHGVIAGVDDNKAYPELVKRYRQIGKAWRTARREAAK